VIGMQDDNISASITFGSLGWPNLVVDLWTLAWMSSYAFGSLFIFMKLLDKDPDKTLKMYKDTKAVMDDLEDSVSRGVGNSELERLAKMARAKQLVLYAKEVQKMLKRGTSVWLVDRGEEVRSAQFWKWKKITIVWSEPKVKDIDFSDEVEFSLYVKGGWPWSRSPPAVVWFCQTPEEYFQRVGACELPEGLTVVKIRYSEILGRLLVTSGYTFFDARYLGWCRCCRRQPKFEWKKMKEEDVRVSERFPGESEVYYDKSRFEWFDRNMEYFNTWRATLSLEMPFFCARLFYCFFMDGYTDMFMVLLLVKNLVFIAFGVVYIAACGNAKHTCGPCYCKPVELMAKCIANTKIGRAIKLSVLMPVRVALECLSCGSRDNTEQRIKEYETQIHMNVLQSSRLNDEDDELRHRRRLLKDRCRQQKQLLEVTDVSNFVKVKQKVKAKDFIA